MPQTVAAILILWSIPIAGVLVWMICDELRRLTAARELVKEAERILAEDLEK